MEETQTDERISVFGVVRVKRIRTDKVDIENETWSYRTYYQEEKELIWSTFTQGVRLSIGDRITIDDKAHKIVEIEYNPLIGELKYFTSTILRSVEDSLTEPSKELSEIQTKKVIAKMKAENEGRQLTNSNDLPKRKRSMLSRILG